MPILIASTPGDLLASQVMVFESQAGWEAHVAGGAPINADHVTSTSTSCGGGSGQGRQMMSRDHVYAEQKVNPAAGGNQGGKGRKGRGVRNGEGRVGRVIQIVEGEDGVEKEGEGGGGWSLETWRVVRNHTKGGTASVAPKTGDSATIVVPKTGDNSAIVVPKTGDNAASAVTVVPQSA